MEKTFEIYCRRCKLSLSLADYPQHIIAIHHKQDDKICEMCEKIFKEEWELEQHLKSHIEKNIEISKASIPREEHEEVINKFNNARYESTLHDNNLIGDASIVK